MSFSLGTGNREAAAKIASGIYTDLLAIGIDATVAKHRAQKSHGKSDGVTIGEWIATASEVFDGKAATFSGYERGLRFVASEIWAVSKTKKRYGRTQAKV